MDYLQVDAKARTETSPRIHLQRCVSRVLNYPISLRSVKPPHFRNVANDYAAEGVLTAKTDTEGQHTDIDIKNLFVNPTLLYSYIKISQLIVSMTKGHQSMSISHIKGIS